MKTKSFKTDKGFLMPVNEKKYLIPFLTGTTKGTKYYDPAPSNVIKKEYLADKYRNAIYKREAEYKLPENSFEESSLKDNLHEQLELEP